MKLLDLTIPLGIALMSDQRFRQGKYNTAFMEKFMDEHYS